MLVQIERTKVKLEKAKKINVVKSDLKLQQVFRKNKQKLIKNRCWFNCELMLIAISFKYLQASKCKKWFAIVRHPHGNVNIVFVLFEDSYLMEKWWFQGLVYDFLSFHFFCKCDVTTLITSARVLFFVHVTQKHILLVFISVYSYTICASEQQERTRGFMCS